MKIIKLIKTISIAVRVFCTFILFLGIKLLIVSIVKCINVPFRSYVKIQSTLVISKSKGPSDTLRAIRTSTYQICRIEENTN